MELNYAIYDGLEMILKVTKNAKKVYVNILWWIMSSNWLLSRPSHSNHIVVKPPWTILTSFKTIWRKKNVDLLQNKKKTDDRGHKDRLIHHHHLYHRIWRLLSTVYVSDGLASSQFCLYTQWSWNESILMLNSLCQSQVVLKEVIYGC